MRREMITGYIEKLTESLPVRPAIHEDGFRKMYDAKDFVGVIRSVSNRLNVNNRLRIGFVKSGGDEQTPMWVMMPRPMPVYGTTDFQRMVIELNVRKDFLASCTFHAFVSGSAHEISHVVLASIMHELQYEEEAVDLTAMILGFRYFFEFGAHRVKSNRLQRYGYLSFEEIRFAIDFIDRQAARAAAL